MVFFHHFHHLPFRAESITAERKSNYTNYEAFRNDDTLGNVLNVSISKKHVRLATLPSRFPKFYIKTVSDDKNYSCDLKMRVEIRGSMLFLRDEKHIFFVDFLNQYKKFNKPVDAIPPTNMLEDFKEPSKLKLINYQELNPSPNKTIITEQIFESHHQTKTAMKKELKGLSKSQKQEVMNELTNK